MKPVCYSLNNNFRADSEPGKLSPIVDSVYKFDDALWAYERLMSGHARGKVVVVIDPEIYLQARQESL